MILQYYGHSIRIFQFKFEFGFDSLMDYETEAKNIILLLKTEACTKFSAKYLIFSIDTSIVATNDAIWHCFTLFKCLDDSIQKRLLKTRKSKNI